MFLKIFFWAVPIGVSFCFALLILFFAISKKDRNTKAFMPLLIFMFIWGMSSVLMKLQVYPGELFWNRVMVISLCCIPLCIYGFFLVFANLMSFKRIYLWIIFTIPLIIFNLMGLVVTEAKMISSVENTLLSFDVIEFSYKLGWGAIPTYFILFAMLIAIAVNVRIFIKKGFLTYKRISPILIGVFILFLGQLLNIFPSVGKYPFDQLTGFINALLILTAIYKNRMIELKFVLTRGIIFTIATIVLTIGYVFLVLKLHSFAQNINDPILPYVTTVMALAIALLFQPLYAFTKKLIDKIFYKTEYTHEKNPEDFNVNISNKLNFNEITSDVTEVIKRALSTNRVYIMLKTRLFKLDRSEAMTDDLTQLYNHRYFHKQLKTIVEQSGNLEVSLIIIDIDMFKLYNDLYGHIEGDKALQQIASAMVKEVSSQGTIARYSGGKFAILLPFYDSNRSYEIAEKIRKHVQDTFFCAEDKIQRFLTLSLGICTFPHFATNQDDLLTRADIALYKAKNNGKNQTVIYSQNTMSQDETLNASLAYSGSHSTTVYALTATIDAKDHFTFGHSQNVAEYSTILAEDLGLDSAHIDIIREAALLHDIGKIGIPEYILTKPGRLERDEYEIIKRHVEMSITIVKHLPSLNHVIPSIIAHHERWDGKGYPRGISGESIPIGARCLSVADSFDAITSPRPYKSAMPVEFALKEIEMQMGKQFDPVIAQRFIELVKSGKITLKNLNPSY